jgi:hypothetical protein
VVGCALLGCALSATAAGQEEHATKRHPSARKAHKPHTGPKAHQSRGGLLWSDGFSSGGFGAWDALDGNTSSRAAIERYFAIVHNPAGRGRVFRATVDGGASTPGEYGQRSLLELFPDSERRGRALSEGIQGRDRWFHASVYFPKNFTPAQHTDWNWAIEWHNWPETTCCENLAVTVDTDPTRGHGWRLSLRSEGGGDPQHPVEAYPAYPRQAGTTHDDHIVGARHLRRGHWYDILMHVVWDYRPQYGLVQWWLDGKRIISRHTSTLYWYSDADADLSGSQPGPGRTYLEVGYYRDNRLLNGSTATSVESVYLANIKVGLNCRSVVSGAFAKRPASACR